MGFSPGLMQGLLNANTAMTQVQAHQRSASHLESRANILESEIKSGYGDIEGKQAELEQVHEQQDKVRKMQQESISQAGSALNTDFAADNEKDTEEAKKTASANKKAEASDSAKEQAAKLQNRLKDHNVAAVEYSKGMQIGEEGKTTTAISPAFLEKLAQDEPLAETYEGHLATMESIEKTHADTLQNTVSHNWTVDSSGLISHHTAVAGPADAAAFEQTRQQIDAAGRAAFGASFGGAHVSLQPKQTMAGSNATGLLINADV